MKSNKGTVLAAATVVVLLAACGIRPDQNAASGEMVAPEVSSQELLISSLQYLLLDDTEEDAQEPDSKDSQDQQTETQDSQDQQTEMQDSQDQQTETQDSQDRQTETQDSQEAAEESGDASDEQLQQEGDGIEGEEAVIYYGNGAFSDLEQEKIKVESVTPDELIGAMARHNIVSLDTKVLSFEQEEQDGASVLYLDLSKSVREYLLTMSREAESIIVASVINTFLDNYDADAVLLTVEGKPLVTSNADYSEQLVRCTPKELMEALELTDEEKSDSDAGNDAADKGQSKLPLKVEKE